MGIGVGLLVEQLLAEEKREFDRRQAVAPVVGAEAANAAGDGAAPAHADSPETIPALAQAPAPGPETPVHQHEARLRLHAIHPGRPAIGPDPFPRLLQDVTPADTVIKSVETPLRRLLGRSP